MTPYILVVAKWRDDVFAALFFDGLPPELRRHVRIVEFGRESLTAPLAGAAAVIVMRHGLFSFGHLPLSAGWARVPRYYFLDDNYILLQEEPELYGPYWSAYSDDGVRHALRGFEGVLLGSATLRQYFENRALHPHLIDYPPIAWPILRTRTRGWTREVGEPFRIAFFGGEHRRELFATTVYPAVQRLAAEQHAIELVLVGIDPATLSADPRVRIVHLPYELEFRAALAELARHNIDAIAHPTPSSRNNEYKNANVLINARAVGAVAVLSDLPPYDALPPPKPALLCANDPAAWHAAFNRLISEPQLCETLFDRADQYCLSAFSGKANAQAIESILAAHPAPTPFTQAARMLTAGPALEFDRVLVRAKALAAAWLRHP